MTTHTVWDFITRQKHRVRYTLDCILIYTYILHLSIAFGKTEDSTLCTAAKKHENCPTISITQRLYLRFKYSFIIFYVFHNFSLPSIFTDSDLDKSIRLCMTIFWVVDTVYI